MVQNWRQTKKWRLERVRHVMERRQKNQERRMIRTFVSKEILKVQ